jgi:hypothetical protein
MEVLAKSVTAKYPWSVLALSGTGQWVFVCACETPEQAAEVAEGLKVARECETRIEQGLVAA